MARHVGISRDRMHVVYNGIDTDRFVPLCSLGSKKGNGRGLSLLYAGSLVPHKGVHIAVEAMAILAQDPALRDITLTIVGAGHPDYEARLKEIMRVDRD